MIFLIQRTFAFLLSITLFFIGVNLPTHNAYAAFIIQNGAKCNANYDGGSDNFIGEWQLVNILSNGVDGFLKSMPICSENPVTDYQEAGKNVNIKRWRSNNDSCIVVESNGEVHPSLKILEDTNTGNGIQHRCSV